MVEIIGFFMGGLAVDFIWRFDWLVVLCVFFEF